VGNDLNPLNFLPLGTALSAIIFILKLVFHF